MELVIWQSQKPTALWIADKWLQKLQVLWLKFLMCDAIRWWLCICIYSFAACVCVCVHVFLSESFLAAANLPPQKKKLKKTGTMEPFLLARPSFLCLSQIGWKQNQSFRGELVTLKQRDNRMQRRVQTMWRGCDLLSSTCNHRAIWSAGKLVPPREWNLSKRREMWTTLEKGRKKTDESRAIESEYRCPTHSAQRRRGLWMHSEWSREVSEVGRTARSLAKGRHRGYAHT